MKKKKNKYYPYIPGRIEKICISNFVCKMYVKCKQAYLRVIKKHFRVSCRFLKVLKVS